MKLLASALCAVLLLTTPAFAQPERFTLEARDVDLADMIRLLGARSGQNVVADGSVKQQRVTLRLKSVTFDEALATLLAAYGLQTHRDGRVVIVGDAASMNRRFPDDATLGGTQTAVFALAHARPDDVTASLQNAL
ncbi:MAG: secretin and TonB N-terminal domain-containing protein, partial [Candidatus Eremiobacteraeota bacterium]|nr:secretin and TonB N-terminal domain-containing protein [Candidatus Eremiobacteraeota bacterium]